MEDDNETWIIEAGDEVVQKRATLGPAALQPLERLIYCLWVADYGMRNAGDLMSASDLYPAFQTEAAMLARDLKLTTSHSAFALPRAELQHRYFRLFDDICNEIRAEQA